MGFPRGAPRAHLLSRDLQACSKGHVEPFPEVMEGSEEGDAVIGPRWAHVASKGLTVQEGRKTHK